MKDSYTLTQTADAELYEIFVNTAQNWGIPQADKYFSRLHEAFDRLAFFPEMGVRRPDLGLHIRMIRHQSHRIYYRANDDKVRIIRILHVRQRVDANMIAIADDTLD